MNMFTFQSVGQGLFYTGDIDDFKFVYDCGSTSKLHGTISITKTDEPALFKAIDYYYTTSSNRIIDFLAISHLDSDHVNGIPELLSKFSVKKVLLPYFQPIIYKSLVFEGYLYLNGISSEMVSYLVRAYSQSEIMEELNLTNDEILNITRYHLVHSHSKVSTNKWVFVFMNNPLNITQKTITQLENDIKTLLFSYKYSDLTIAMTDNKFIVDLRNIYKSRFGKNNLNQTSTILLHYPITESHIDKSTINFREFNEYYRFKYSTLLTGDVDFKNLTALAVRVNDEIERSNLNVLICSLPHHGSNNNFLSLIANINIQHSNLVMTYGIVNPWPKSFPNYKTISMLSKMSNRLIYVNEYQNFKYFV